MPPPPGLTRTEKVKFAFSSTSNFHEAIKLPDSSRLHNEDLAPSPPERRRWSVRSYFSFWWAESWNVSTWSVGSSLIATGMTIRDAILVVFFANLVSAIVIVLNGRAAAKYHIGFPALARSAFGTYGSYFYIIVRSILGIIWGGVQLYFTGQFISVILRCIFSGWSKIPNGIPVSQGITTQEMVGFFLAFLVTLPFMFVHTSKITPLFAIKSFVMPIAGVGLVIWATKNNGGVSGGVVETAMRPDSTTVFAFMVMSQFNSIMGSNSALLITVPDISRYAKTPKGQMWGQLISLPVAQTLCASFGIIVTSAVQSMWGVAYWNPYSLLNGILDQAYNANARAGCFFAALSFGFATLGTSLACNFLPFGADVSALLPKYMNIIRGQVLCLVLAFAITPWHILTSAPTFLNFLGGYSIFQGNVVAIMLVDYYIVRKGNIDIRDLYSESRDAKYYYTFGNNWRAAGAFLSGFAVPLAGFIGSFGTTTVSTAASRMYALGWALSFVIGGLTYWILCLIWPVPGDDSQHSFEQLSKYYDEHDIAELRQVAQVAQTTDRTEDEKLEPKMSV